MNSKTRNFLRKRAHFLKPAVMVGKEGADSRIEKALDEALNKHELVKVRFQNFKEECRPIAEELSDKVKAQLVTVTGHVAIIFRQNEKQEERLIHIPKDFI